MLRTLRSGLSVAALAAAVTGALLASPGVAFADPAAPGHPSPAPSPTPVGCWHWGPDVNWGVNKSGWQIDVYNGTSHDLKVAGDNAIYQSPNPFWRGQHATILGTESPICGPADLRIRYGWAEEEKLPTSQDTGSIMVQATMKGDMSGTKCTPHGHVQCTMAPFTTYKALSVTFTDS